MPATGRIYGVEVGGQYAFGDSIAWLNGFGAAANYTYSASQSNARPTSFSTTIPHPGRGRGTPLTGTLYYERSGFSARASYSWRDKAVNDSLVGADLHFPDANGVRRHIRCSRRRTGSSTRQLGYDFNQSRRNDSSRSRT